MALFVRQDDVRSELQQRIAAELQEKAKNKAREDERPDGVDDAAFMKGTKNTSSLLGVWLLIAAVTIGLIIWLIIQTAS